MLPPKSVPEDLPVEEYMKLRIRYETLGWMSQLTKCARLIIDKAPPNPAYSEEKLKVISGFLRGAEQLIFATELRSELLDMTGNLVGLGLSKADQLTEKFEGVQKAKTGFLSALSVIGDTVQSKVDDALERHVLPAIGLPVDDIPPGKTPEEYLDLADKYSKLGLAEPTRNVLKHLIKTFPDSPAALSASRRLRTRVPLNKVTQAAQRRYLHAVRDSLIANRSTAKDAYQDLIRDFPDFEWPYINLSAVVLKDGDLESATALANKALAINQASLRGWANMARIHLVEWKLDLLRQNTEKMEQLEPGNDFAQVYRSIIEFIETSHLDR